MHSLPPLWNTAFHVFITYTFGISIAFIWNIFCKNKKILCLNYRIFIFYDLFRSNYYTIRTGFLILYMLELLFFYPRYYLGYILDFTNIFDLIFQRKKFFWKCYNISILCVERREIFFIVHVFFFFVIHLINGRTHYSTISNFKFL